MNEYLLLKFAHIIAFVYWLGGDLGTFIASRQVANDKLSAESRHVALKIMLACDMGPKLAMPLILPLGVQLAATAGMATLPGWALLCLWLVSAYWFTVVMVLFSLSDGYINNMAMMFGPKATTKTQHREVAAGIMVATLATSIMVGSIFSNLIVKKL